MQNQANAVSRRLSDPDVQASLVNKCIALTMCFVALECVRLVHDVYIWINPPKPVFFRIEPGTPHGHLNDPAHPGAEPSIATFAGALIAADRGVRA